MRFRVGDILRCKSDSPRTYFWEDMVIFIQTLFERVVLNVLEDPD